MDVLYIECMVQHTETEKYILYWLWSTYAHIKCMTSYHTHAPYIYWLGKTLCIKHQRKRSGLSGCALVKSLYGFDMATFVVVVIVKRL